MASSRTSANELETFLKQEKNLGFVSNGHHSSLRPAPWNRDRGQGRVHPLPRPASIRRQRDGPCPSRGCRGHVEERRIGGLPREQGCNRPGHPPPEEDARLLH